MHEQGLSFEELILNSSNQEITVSILLVNFVILCNPIICIRHRTSARAVQRDWRTHSRIKNFDHACQVPGYQREIDRYQNRFEVQDFLRPQSCVSCSRQKEGLRYAEAQFQLERCSQSIED